MEVQINERDLFSFFDDLDEGFKMEALIVTEKMAWEVYGEAVKLVKQRLNSTAGIYLNALQEPEQQSDGSFIIRLDDSASHLEEGYPGFDMIDALLKHSASGKIKTSKKGKRYRRIPLTYSAKGVAGSIESTLARIDSITNRLDKIKAPSGAREGLKSKADLLREVERYSGRNKAAIGRAKPKHPYLQGMQKTSAIMADPSSPSGYRKIGRPRNSLTSFRTISEASEKGWMHPGFAGVHIFETLEWYIAEKLSLILSEF